MRLGFTLVVGLVMAFWLVGGLRLAGYKVEISLAGDYAFDQHRQDVRAAIAQIPPDASVASLEFLLPHLANRYELTNLDAGGTNLRTFRPTYIVCDALDAQDSR